MFKSNGGRTEFFDIMMNCRDRAPEKFHFVNCYFQYLRS